MADQKRNRDRRLFRFPPTLPPIPEESSISDESATSEHLIDTNVSREIVEIPRNSVRDDSFSKEELNRMTEAKLNQMIEMHRRGYGFKELYESVDELAVLQQFDVFEMMMTLYCRSLNLKSEGTMIHIMTLFSTAGMVEQAVRTLYEMQEAGFIQTAMAARAMLDVYLDNKRFNKVHLFFHEVFKKFGVRRDVFAYNVLLRAVVQERLLGFACSLVEMMLKVGFKLNVVIFNTLVSGFIREVHKDVFDQMEQHKCKPIEISLCETLAKKLEKKQFDQVYGLFAEMREELGISYLSVFSHNIVLKAFVEQKSVYSACKFLEIMKENEIQPNVVSYNTLLSWFSEVGDFGLFDELLKEMEDKNIDPDSNTYSYRISMLCTKNRDGVFQAKQLLREMVSKGIQPNPTSITAVLDAFCKRGDVESGRELLQIHGYTEFLAEEMKKKEQVQTDRGASTWNNSSAWFVAISNAIEVHNFNYAMELIKRSMDKKWVFSLRAFSMMRGA